MAALHVVGIDLSGPSNADATALTCVAVERDGTRHVETREHVGDRDIAHVVARRAETDPVIVGLDAPLSYAVGGGDRPADRSLRERLQAAGLPAGTVMAPTMTRMAHLTLRGVVIARTIERVACDVEIVEVHPAGALVLHGAPVEDVVALKRDAAARRRLAEWLGARIDGLPLGGATPSDHVVAAWAAAFGTCRWLAGESAWLASAEPPHRPYDYCC